MLVAVSTATLSTIFAAIAAGAALAAVYFASRTVAEARRAASEARVAHAAALAEQKELVQATHAARGEAGEAAVHAFNRALIADRLRTLSRIADLLRQIVDVARSEERTIVAELQSSPLSSIAIHLQIEIALFVALRGVGADDLAAFASRARGRGVARGMVLGEAVDELTKLERLIEVDKAQLATALEASVQMVASAG